MDTKEEKIQATQGKGWGRPPWEYRPGLGWRLGTNPGEGKGRGWWFRVKRRTWETNPGHLIATKR